jgi:hypothetical protein
MINLGPVSESDWRGANNPAKFHRRAQRAIHFEATRPVQIMRSGDGRWLTGLTGEDSVHSAIARLELGGPGLVEFIDIIFPSDGPFPGYWYTSSEDVRVNNIEFVNDWLAITHVAGTVGTDLAVARDGDLWEKVAGAGLVGGAAGGIVAVTGAKHFDRRRDWDMVMKGLIIILYRHGHKLKPQVYGHVLYNLLGKWSGPHDPSVLVPAPIPCLETENHVLMIETHPATLRTSCFIWKDGREAASILGS